MADDDNQYNDEYQFSDLDVISPDSLDEDKDTSETESSSKTQAGEGKKNIRRNALIAVSIIVLVMLAYKFISAFFSGKSHPVEKKASVPPITATVPQPAPVIHEQPVAPAQTAPVVVQQPNPENSQISQKLSALEMGQQNVRSDMNSLNSQLTGINSKVNELTEKIAALSQMLNVLASKVDQQSNEIAILMVRTKPKPVRRVTTIKIPIRTIYYIRAVIPGRAWLIATNGSTLTVREGTHIAGYGIVKLIDAIQGRVVTSSGQVIRFSQQDS